MPQSARWIALAALVVGLAAGPAAGQGELPPPSQINSVAVEGDRAYVVDRRPFPGYLRVLSVADPARPTQLAAGELTYCSSPALAGLSAGVAEVLCFYGSYAVDARVLVDPLPTRQFGTPTAPEGSSIAGGRLYITHTYGGGGDLRLSIYDLADPVRPASLGHGSLAERGGTGHAIAATTTHAFVAWRQSNVSPPELLAVDATDPANPRVVGRMTISGDASPSAAATDGRQLYVAVGERIVVVDVADPAAPHEVGAVSTPGLTAARLRLASARMYAGGTGGLLVLDLADPRTPVLRGTHVVPGGVVYDVAVGGRYAYLALRTAGLRVVDVGDPDRPSLVGLYGTQRSYVPVLPQNGPVG